MNDLTQEQLVNTVIIEGIRRDIRPTEHGCLLAMFSYFLNDLQGKRILDIGCGGDGSYGYVPDRWLPAFPRLAKSYGVDAVGIDPRIDPQKESFEAYRAGVEDLPKLFPDESFDGVLVKDFWSDPRVHSYVGHLQHQTSKEIFRILRPNGVSINYSNEEPNLRVFAPQPERLSEIGFEVVYYFTYPESGYGQDLIVLRKPALR